MWQVINLERIDGRTSLAQVSNPSSKQKWKYGWYKVSVALKRLLENGTQCIMGPFPALVYTCFTTPWHWVVLRGSCSFLTFRWEGREGEKNLCLDTRPALKECNNFVQGLTSHSHRMWFKVILLSWYCNYVNCFIERVKGKGRVRHLTWSLKHLGRSVGRCVMQLHGMLWGSRISTHVLTILDR